MSRTAHKGKCGDKIHGTMRQAEDTCAQRTRLQDFSAKLKRDKSQDHETKSRDRLNETAWCAKSKTAYASSRAEKMRNRDAMGSCRRRARVRTDVETHVRAETRQRDAKHAALGLATEMHGSKAKGRTRSPVARAAASRRNASRGSVFQRRPRRRGPASVILALYSRDEPGQKGAHHPVSVESPVWLARGLENRMRQGHAAEEGPSPHGSETGRGVRESWRGERSRPCTRENHAP